MNVIDTLRFNNDADFLYRLPTALGMQPNHEYWCKCTWGMNGINKTATSDRLDLRWQLCFQWHRRGIELVLLDCFTMRLFHSATILLLLHMYLLFEASPGWLPGWRVFLFVFYTPVFRRDVLWYDALCPSICPSVRPTVSTKKHRCKWRIFFKFGTQVCLGVPSINLLFVLSYLIKYAHNSIISDFSIFGIHRVIF